MGTNQPIESWEIQNNSEHQLAIVSKDRAICFIPKQHPECCEIAKLIQLAPQTKERVEKLVLNLAELRDTNDRLINQIAEKTQTIIELKEELERLKS